MGLFTVHAFAAGRHVRAGEGLIFPPDYRYQRYWMPATTSDASFYTGNDLSAYPLDSLGMYSYGTGDGDHKHTVVKSLFRQPPGAK